jgi:adenine-specific DNA-methyltransferase
VLAQCYIATDAMKIDDAELAGAIEELSRLPGRRGYFTETFCESARFFQPKNGMRVDAIRDELQASYAESPLFPILLTSLMLAADRVDSTTGVQMAYVKQWAPRSFNPLELRVPELLEGPGHAVKGDAVELAPELGHFDLAYLDPPYNQHRYFTNYHVWETIVAWDAPEAYGVARKRIDSRDTSTRSAFNSKRTMPEALGAVVASVDCGLLVLSYNDESWLALEELEAMCAQAGPQGARAVATLAFDSTRYVGARIGIFDPSGRKVGRVSHLSNRELLVIAGEADLVRAVVTAVRSGGSAALESAGSRRRTDVLAAPAADRLQQAT